MLKDIISVLYLKKDVEIDTTLFKECHIADNIEQAKEIFNNEKIGLIICDLEIDKVSTFIGIAKSKFPSFPLILLEKLAKKKYDFDFTFKLLKPFNLEGFRKNIKKNEQTFIDFFEKHLEETITVEESIEVFFTKKNSEIEAIISSTNISKELDFEIMKPFVYTAYNNFVFIDKKIEKGPLKQIKEDYDKIQWMYKNLIRSTDKGLKELYKVIFLENFTEYKKVMKRLTEGKKALFEFQKRVKRINDRALEIQSILEGGVTAAEKEELDTEKKTLKGSYTDIVHNISLVQESNHELVKKMELIEEEHIDEFKEEFDLQKEDIKKKYTKLLDKFTFYFNRELWLAAKKSRIILEYFENGQVNGFLNSKTYLEYFLANIDTSKAGDTTRKMVDYLKNYNKTNRVNIALLTEDQEFYFDYSPVIRRIDPTLFTYQYNKVDNFIKNFEKHNFEIVIVDFYSNVIKSKKMLDMLKEKLPDNVILASLADKNPYEGVIYKNFKITTKDAFQKDFKMIIT